MPKLTPHCFSVDQGQYVDNVNSDDVMLAFFNILMQSGSSSLVSTVISHMGKMPCNMQF